MLPVLVSDREVFQGEIHGNGEAVRRLPVQVDRR